MMMRIGMDHTWLREVGVRIANIDALRLSPTTSIVLTKNTSQPPLHHPRHHHLLLFCSYCSIHDRKNSIYSLPSC